MINSDIINDDDVMVVVVVVVLVVGKARQVSGRGIRGDGW